MACGRQIEPNERRARVSERKELLQLGDWTERGKLVPSSAVPNGRVGAAVALQADTLLVSSGASASTGAVTVFFRVGLSWQEQATLKPADAKDNDYFGLKPALDANSVAVSSMGSPNGAVHVFVRSGSSWTEQAKLVTLPSTQEVYGASLAIS